MSERRVGGNINDWAEAARELKKYKEANTIDEPRNVGFEKLDKLDLPRYKRINLPLVEFLGNPTTTLSEIGSEKFYISLIPNAKELPRYGTSGLSAEEVLSYINEHVTTNNQENYTLFVQEYFDNLYGGNIIINPSGQIYSEFKSGKQGPIAKGKATPEFTIKRDQHFDSFKYSFEDSHLREIMHDTILSIPHKGEGRDAEYLPGYYEFVIVKKKPDGTEEPIFIDYKNNPAFLIPEE